MFALEIVINMKPFDLNNLKMSEFKKEFDKKIKIKSDNIQEAMFLYTKDFVEKKHGKEYQVVMEHTEDGIIIKPEDGKEKTAQTMEFGIENENGEQPPKPAWRLAEINLKKEAKKNTQGTNLMKKYKDKVNPKGFGV